MRHPGPPTVIRRISRLRSSTRTHRPILPHSICEVAIVMIATPPMGKSLIPQTPISPIPATDNRRLDSHHRTVTRSTMTSLAASTITLRLDLATLLK
ncbi:hypothetical protein BHE90_017183 [Fusarium euwallaceae]|uniref:Uncharacterized protein n=1 Tax=Fusarium euwallaceae TaxID=1147111 RepID=A0A430KY70_9HYPO|nr:hypothetical protein BHE90_017183 [Fusarium euwallaceae]